MPMTPEQVEHKLRQHDSEIVTIYDMLAEIKETVTAHDARFDGIDGRLDGIDGRLDGHEARFDAIDATLAEVLRRLPEPQ